MELCEEDKTELEMSINAWNLMRSMHGTRAAARNWQSAMSGTMKDLDLGKAEHLRACSGIGKETEIKALVHGND